MKRNVSLSYFFDQTDIWVGIHSFADCSYPENLPESSSRRIVAGMDVTGSET